MAVQSLQHQADQFRNHKQATVSEELRAKIADYQITAADLMLSAGKPSTYTRVSGRWKKKAAPDCRNAAGQSWSGGRGRKPAWVADAPDAGESVEKYRVQ